jgi:hypothetical protein
MIPIRLIIAAVSIHLHNVSQRRVSYISFRFVQYNLLQHTFHFKIQYYRSMTIVYNSLLQPPFFDIVHRLQLLKHFKILDDGQAPPPKIVTVRTTNAAHSLPEFYVPVTVHRDKSL